MIVPAGLRRWFVVHFVIDLLFGVPLLLFPEPLLTLLRWPAIDVFSARLVGAALLGIGSISFLARDASRESYQHLLTLKIIWSASAIIAILLSMMSGGYPPIGWAMLALFAAFFCVWTTYRVRLQ